MQGAILGLVESGWEVVGESEALLRLVRLEMDMVRADP